MRRLTVGFISLLASVALVATPSAANAKAEGNGPAFQTFPASILYGVAHPGVAPSGANDWNCKPTAAQPRPVVLVHGTFANQFNSFSYLSPKLKSAGKCVFSVNYGKGTSPVYNAAQMFGSVPIMDSAREVAAFVERVRATTGSAKVDMVGYSQGAVVVRTYLKFFGGADAVTPANNRVQTVVSLSGSNHGTTLNGIANLGRSLNLLGLVGAVGGQALADQVVGSPFMTALNAGGDTMPGINYTLLTTKYDEVVTPYKSSFLVAGPGATVNNIVIQDGCFIDYSDHLSMPFSLRAADYTLKALDPAKARYIGCTLEFPAI